MNNNENVDLNRRAILENGDVVDAGGNLWLHDFWGENLNESTSHGSYRPLTVLSFRMTYQWAGLYRRCYHATNVALHCAVTALVVRLGRHLMNGRPAGVYLSGLLFAAHPVHCEAVAGLVGRADLGTQCISALRTFYSTHFS